MENIRSDPSIIQIDVRSPSVKPLRFVCCTCGGCGGIVGDRMTGLNREVGDGGVVLVYAADAI
jgi:hypothetical protein